tara:strand:+ start:1125 stop:1391 length:267 start_codon:yes stop_codon:yes gene_type:complete
MSPLEEIVHSLFCQTFQTALSYHELAGVIVIGDGSEFESILVVTFLMEVQDTLSKHEKNIDIFELFFNHNTHPITLNDLVEKLVEAIS